jgi:hypothetical protein
MFSPRPLPGSLTAPAPKPRRQPPETRVARKHALQMQPAKSSGKRLPSRGFCILYAICLSTIISACQKIGLGA